MQSSLRFSTEIINLKKVSNKRFVIPTYQRPYVWKEEQISKLLKDCALAFVTHSDKSYFIGTILTSDKKEFQELIDGQQRFTTLWLIAVVFHKQKIKSSITKYLKLGDHLRLGFEIREEVEKYFNLLESNPNEALVEYSEEQLEESIYLKDISKAVSTIESILLSLSKDLKREIDLSKFGDYLYSQVMMVNNITPSKIDLNKLFATINNSGVQLEQTDIVKANLLNRLETEKILYSKIWESCENLDDYFEKNVRKIFTETRWNEISVTEFSFYHPSQFRFDPLDGDTKESHPMFSIRKIIDNLNKEEELREENAINVGEEKYCRSIINFGQLLLHTYRIFLKKKGKKDFEGTFHTNRLIEIFKAFEKESEEDVKAFFKLLWEVRYHFDKEVIKWVIDLDSKNEYLELTSVHENTSQRTQKQFNRNVIERNESTMLQSVLYFTGDYLRQYWLTPFLYRLVEQKEEPIILLESIDNIMSISLHQDKDISFHLCNSDYKDENTIDIETELKEARGTGFKHYWFQKLEYILWKDWDKKDPKFQNFRITSKNSVEHVFPQNHEFDVELKKEFLDSFGNLGLLSVSQNSSYSNQSVVKKKDDFKNKMVYDSLKLALIYSDSNIDKWGVDEIKQHKEKMIGKFKQHYNL